MRWSQCSLDARKNQDILSKGAFKITGIRSLRRFIKSGARGVFHPLYNGRVGKSFYPLPAPGSHSPTTVTSTLLLLGRLSASTQ